ncbi:hypothetical protein [Amycolatopsis thermoflava]|uniref:hypothetical protein n=1 Tax=Amycolatopsis thermoflava TaxID=84480 RepID=UPI000423D768|nr:hypothetical protein [Amycolatopsis thermoflava]
MKTQLDGQQGGYGLGVLSGLQNKHVYGGTARPERVSARRAKNRRGRKSRRINRLRAA